MKNKLFISSKLEELIAFLKKELTKPVTFLEPKDYERNMPKRIENLKPNNTGRYGGFYAYINGDYPMHRSDNNVQKGL